MRNTSSPGGDVMMNWVIGTILWNPMKIEWTNLKELYVAWHAFVHPLFVFLLNNANIV